MSENSSLPALPLRKEMDEKKFVRLIAVEKVNSKFKILMISWHVATLENEEWIQVERKATERKTAFRKTKQAAVNKLQEWYSNSLEDGWTLDADNDTGLPLN